MDGGGGGRLSLANGGSSTSSSGGGGGKNSTVFNRHCVTSPFTSRSAETMTSCPRDVTSLVAPDGFSPTEVLLGTSDHFLVCFGNVAGASLMDALVPGCDCDAAILDDSTADVVCGGVASVGGGGTMSAVGSTSMTTLLHSAADVSHSGGGPATDCTDPETSWSVSDGGGGTIHARYGANDGLTKSSNVELVVRLTQTSSVSTVGSRRCSTAVSDGLTRRS